LQGLSVDDPDFDPKYNSIIVLEENTHIAGVPKGKIETTRRALDGYAQQRKGGNWALVA
jgi:hypothetical protein